MVRPLHYKMNQCRQKLFRGLPTRPRHLNTNHKLGQTSQFLLPPLHRRPRRRQWSDRAVKMSQIAEKEALMPPLCPLLLVGLIQMRLSLGPEELVRPPAGRLQVHKFPTPLLQVRSWKNPNTTRLIIAQPTRHHQQVRRHPCLHQPVMRPTNHFLCQRRQNSQGSGETACSIN
jgi:hypothetical protein